MKQPEFVGGCFNGGDDVIRDRIAVGTLGAGPNGVIEKQ